MPCFAKLDDHKCEDAQMNGSFLLELEKDKAVRRAARMKEKMKMAVIT